MGSAVEKKYPEQNAELLKHERVHVELAERHARYILQQIKMLNVAGSDMNVACKQLLQSVDCIIRDHWNKRLANMNAQYERETDHGTIPKCSRTGTSYTFPWQIRTTLYKIGNFNIHLTRKA